MVNRTMRKSTISTASSWWTERRKILASITKPEPFRAKTRVKKAKVEKNKVKKVIKVKKATKAKRILKAKKAKKPTKVKKVVKTKRATKAKKVNRVKKIKRV